MGYQSELGVGNQRLPPRIARVAQNFDETRIKGVGEGYRRLALHEGGRRSSFYSHEKGPPFLMEYATVVEHTTSRL